MKALPRNSGKIHLFASACLAISVAQVPLASAALPQGRSWSLADTTKVAGHTHLYPHRLDVGEDGIPLVFGTVIGGIGGEGLALRWQGDHWEVVSRLGYRTAFLHPTISLTADRLLIWQTLDQIDLPGPPYSAAYLVVARFEHDHYVDPDTIDTVFNANWIYSASSSRLRRWAVKSDGANGLVAWYSNAERVWHRISLPGRGGGGVCVAGIDDTTAIIVWLDVGAPIHWGLLRDGQWQDGGIVPGDVYGGSQGPHFRLSPSGKLWLVWSTDAPFVQYAVFENGVWTPADSLSAREPNASYYFSKELRPSRDRWEYPVITWVENDAFRGFLGSLCVSIPDANGRYSQGETLAGAGDALFGEAVRDSLGDAWLVWRTTDDGMFSTHTYVRSVISRVGVDGRGRKRVLTWTLDQPAVDSWWSVLRARDDGPFEEVGRAKAGDGVDLAWLDESPPRGHLRYKIRRDCLDTRYQWESAVAHWPTRSVNDIRPLESLRTQHLVAPTLKAPARPLGQIGELELSEPSSGEMDVGIYDLQGRLVLERSGSAMDGRLHFVLGDRNGIASGVYFVRVRLPEGPWSAAVRTVIVK